MENKEKNLVKYLVLGGALGLSYLVIQYLCNRKNSKVKPLSLEKTARILQEIKFQMLTTCFNYAEAVKVKQKNTYAEQDLEIVFRTELAKICEAREDAVLNKYNLSREQYSVSLGQHGRDGRIQRGQAQIFEMMERAVKGNHPDLTVPTQASRLFSNEQLLAIYLEMCELISVRLWQKLEQSKRNNPAFNSKNEAHYKKAVQELSIYDIKSNFLQQKGFRLQWGPPNEVFYKIMEAAKLQSSDFKSRANKIQSAYNKTVQIVTNQPQVCNPQRIKFMMEESINQKQPAPAKEANAEVRNFVSRPSPVTQSLSKQTKPKKEEEFNMEDLMMQELLSRSAENSNPVKQEPPAAPQAIAETRQLEQKANKIENEGLQNTEVQQQSIGAESKPNKELEKVEEPIQPEQEQELNERQIKQEGSQVNVQPTKVESSQVQHVQAGTNQTNNQTNQLAVNEERPAAETKPQDAPVEEKPQQGQNNIAEQSQSLGAKAQNETVENKRAEENESNEIRQQPEQQEREIKPE